MRIDTRTIGGLLTAAALITGCRESQTDKKVTTKTSGGEAATSISGDSADKRGIALVRVVDAVAAVPKLVVRADPTKELAVAEYKKVTEYKPIDRNWVTFEVSTGMDSTFKPLATNREMLTDGHRYTLVVMPANDSSKNLETRVLRDEITNDSANAQIRVIHAAKGIDEVDVVQRGTEGTLMEGVNFSSEGGYKSVKPWNGTLEIRTEDGKRLLHTIANLKLLGGHSYTIVLMRGKGGKLESFQIDDAQVGM